MGLDDPGAPGAHLHGHIEPEDAVILGYPAGVRVRVLANHGERYYVLFPDDQPEYVEYEQLGWARDGKCRWCDGIGPLDKWDDEDMTDVVGLMMDHGLTFEDACEGWAYVAGRPPATMRQRVAALAAREGVLELFIEMGEEAADSRKVA